MTDTDHAPLPVTQELQDELEAGIQAELERNMATAMGEAPVFKLTEATVTYRPDGCVTPRGIHLSVGTTRSHGLALVALRRGLDAIRQTLESGGHQLGSA